MHRGFGRWVVALVVVAMAAGIACDGSSGAEPTGDAADGGNAPGTPRTIGGSLSGLSAGASVVLRNGAEALTLKADGPYVFATPVPSGATYEVTVDKQPPGQVCTVSHARDTVGASDVTDVNVACVEGTKRTVGGTLTGLIQGATVTIRNNAGDSLSLTAAGPFTFPVRIAEGLPYAVTVSSFMIGPSPLPLEICPVTNGTGIVGNADVTNVVVGCPDAAYKILHDFEGGDDGAKPRGALLEVNGTLYGTTKEGGPGNFGTVFKIALDGTGYTRLLAFKGGADGAAPREGLVRDASGNFYGTTESGGTSDYGTVFKLTPGAAGTFTKTVLHHFGPGTDGRYPAGLVLDGAGKLVGTTFAGGDGTDNGPGIVYRLSTDGSGYGVVHTFAGGLEGAGATAPLAKDASGSLFGTTSSGLKDTVFKLTPNGSGGYTYKLIYTFFGDDSGLRPYGGVILDAAGNLFGTTFFGGNQDRGLVYKLSDGGGGYLQTVLSLLGDDLGVRPEAGLLLDKQGRLRGVSSTGGNGGGAIFSLVPDGAGKYTAQSDYVFGQLTQTDGYAPTSSLVSDAQGRVYGTTFRGGKKDLGILFRFAL